MADYTPAGATWDPNTNTWIPNPGAPQWQGGQVGKVGTGDVGNWLGDAGDALSGNTRARATAYGQAPVDAAQQPWLSSLATAAGETPELQAQQSLASDRERLLAEAAAINPTATRDQLVGVGDQFGVDTRRQAGGIEALSTEFGNAPSYADEASRATMDRASAEATARAASARGPNAALQLREAAGMNAGAARMAASEAGALKAKEMSDRYGQRAGMLGQAAGVTAAGAAGQGNLYGAAGGAELAARGQRADTVQGASNLAVASGELGLSGQQNRTGAASAGGQIATSGQGIVAGSHDATMASNMETNRQNSANRKESTSGLLTSAAGMLAMFSDVRAKTDIRRSKLSEAAGEMAEDPDANREALAPVRDYTFRYRPAAARRMGTDTEPRPGIMAQDLERSEAGEEVVFDTPNGKALDRDKALGFSLAGVAGLDKRMTRLEKLRLAAGER